MTDCQAQAEVYSDGYVMCDLPDGHPGLLHYDELHDVTWRKGKPE